MNDYTVLMTRITKLKHKQSGAGQVPRSVVAREALAQLYPEIYAEVEVAEAEAEVVVAEVAEDSEEISDFSDSKIYDDYDDEPPMHVVPPIAAPPTATPPTYHHAYHPHTTMAHRPPHNFARW